MTANSILLTRDDDGQTFGMATPINAEEVSKLKSFEATLEGEKWIVYAHHNKQLKLNQIPPSNGGSFDVEVAVDQGSILAVRVEM